MMNAATRARRRPGAVLLLACLALGLAAPAAAQWKWRDKNGQMHISDLPPPHEVQDKDILQRPAAARKALVVSQAASDAASAVPAAATSAGASAPAADNRLAAEAEARRAKAQQEEQARRKAVEDANAATRADNCQRARRMLATLDSGQRIARSNDKGEREVLDDKGRAEESARARAIVASDCK
jgi:hypothetical protein